MIVVMGFFNLFPPQFVAGGFPGVLSPAREFCFAAPGMARAEHSPLGLVCLQVPRAQLWGKKIKSWVE